MSPQTDGRGSQSLEGATCVASGADRSLQSSELSFHSLPQKLEKPITEVVKVVKKVKRKTKSKSSSVRAHDSRDSVKDAYSNSRQLTKWEREENIINLHQ